MRLSLLTAFVAYASVAALAQPARAADMTFSTLSYGSSRQCVDDCPRIMQASGQITASTPQALIDFARREVARPGLINVLLIHSPGGSVNASIAMGRVLRKMGTTVIVARAMDIRELPTATIGRREPGVAENLRFVSGTCASACVYALAGGLKRVVPQESRIAVHRMAGNIANFDPATREFQQRQIYAGETELNALTAYIYEMGISTDLVDMAESVPHENARILSNREIRALRLGQPKL
ncbi:MAG TPA: hypothetical protein PLQ11_05285 [Beijerinckiaceae bacterium]|nr:hypothetical protein [Beijerinckiaceae bacterium]